MQVVRIEPIIRFLSSQNWIACTKNWPLYRRTLREVEGQVQKQQDQVSQSQEKLESLKGQGEGARLEEQRLQLAF